VKLTAQVAANKNFDFDLGKYVLLLCSTPNVEVCSTTA